MNSSMNSFKTSYLSRLLAVAVTLQLLVPISNADPFPNWVFSKKATASDEAENDWFGRAVAVEGDIGLVGATGKDGIGSDSGAVYVINTKTEEELFKLTASNAATENFFGTSVAISETKAIVTATGSNDFAGSAYLFDITTGIELDILVPSVVEADAFFGNSCDMEGNYVIVGAPFEDNGGTDRGVAYVFDVTTGNELLRLIAPDGSNSDLFGRSVAISGNYAIVGAPNATTDDEFTGKVYVFDLSAGGAFLYSPIPSVLEDLAEFGISVAARGDRLVVGAEDENAGGNDYGAAYLFELSTRTELKRLVSNEPTDNGKFGDSVAMSGDLIVVGARDENAGGNDRGAAHIYSASDGSFLQRVTAPDGEDRDDFGVSVAATNDYVIVGARFEDSDLLFERGAVYVFKGTTLPPAAISRCNTVLKTKFLKKAKKLKKKAKAAKKNGKVAKAEKLKKKAKKLIKRANALC